MTIVLAEKAKNIFDKIQISYSLDQNGTVYLIHNNEKYTFINLSEFERNINKKLKKSSRFNKLKAYFELRYLEGKILRGLAEKYLQFYKIAVMIHEIIEMLNEKEKKGELNEVEKKLLTLDGDELFIVLAFLIAEHYAVNKKDNFLHLLAYKKDINLLTEVLKKMLIYHLGLISLRKIATFIK